MPRPKKDKLSLKKELVKSKKKKKPHPQSSDKRKHKADDISLKKYEEMGARGLYDYQIADAVGLSKDRFPALKQRCPEIRDAIAKGKSKSLMHMMNVVFEIADNKEYDPRVRLDAAKYYLKSAGGFKENSDPLIHINMNESYIDKKEEKEIVTYQDAQDTYLDLIREPIADGGG